MEQSFTRLVHIPSGRIERFPISQMPDYMAVSHTWADQLFAAGSAFQETPGSKAIACLSDSEMKKIDYCWIDTLCIDQNDPGDKRRQIPLMGDIYGNAQVVIIVTGERLGLSQAEIDQIAASVEDAVQMSETDSWLQDGEQWTSSQQHRSKLKKAMDCLEIFTRPTWGTRVWTLQEFILAKRIIWVGGDLQPVKIDEGLFQAIPNVCDYLAIEECLVSKYSKLYSHFSGMAGAHLKKIEPTRVMELLGNRTATVPEDEIYGLMAASGVVLHETGITGKEKVWALWWEKAIQTGHFRWAMLPPAIPLIPDPRDVRNCIMPQYSVRHLASTNSILDVVKPHGPTEVSAGVVTMQGRLAGRCEILRRLGRIHIDEDGAVIRDVTLILFANNDWNIALRIAGAFGAGRYSFKQRAMIAQVLQFNHYRAKLAVLEQRTRLFRPRFRNQRQKYVWSDFMLLQSNQMRVMNDSLAFLAKISNNLKMTDVVVVTDGHAPTHDLWAIDFGAINDSKKTMFTIVRGEPGVTAVSLSPSCQGPESPSLHREGVSMFAQVTDDVNQAIQYSCHIIDQATDLQSFRVGGKSCLGCQSIPTAVVSEDSLPSSKQSVVHSEDTLFLRFGMRVKMRKQNQALKTRLKSRRALRRTRRFADHRIG